MPEMSTRFPGAIVLTADTVFQRPPESCRTCGYTPDDDPDGGEPLIDDEQCVDCHFDELQAAERAELWPI